MRGKKKYRVTLEEGNSNKRVKTFVGCEDRRQLNQVQHLALALIQNADRTEKHLGLLKQKPEQ